MEITYIYGKHAVLEVLKERPDSIKTVYVKTDTPRTEVEIRLLERAPDIQELNPKRLPGQLDGQVVHQGWVASLETDKILTPFKDFKRQVPSSPDTCLVMLGEVQDPHNVGAIIRSATAFGAAAVLIPKHRQAPLSGAVIKVSAGTAFSIPLISVGNVNTALRELKELGFWVYGLAADGDTSLHEEDFPKPTVLVVGNEGKGVRLKTHELCDSILSIPMSQRAESLNASVGAAVALYAFSAQHPTVLK